MPRKRQPPKYELRRADALRMRARRMTYQQIADKHYNGDRSNAYKDIQKALKDLQREPAEDVLKQELESIDELERVFLAKALKGDRDAFDRVMKAKERRAKYLGLDAPKDVNLNTGGDIIAVFDPSLDNSGRTEPEAEVDTSQL
ncbi:hypothetical protein [Nesterenkonia rhizosphaerae]|uniref:Terminase small subunit n=1 Tax=Nesterenkonia rhizosphaerae TaxID=1348272 RepID=A0ABP9FTR9_9MICC